MSNTKSRRNRTIFRTHYNFEQNFNPAKVDFSDYIDASATEGFRKVIACVVLTAIALFAIFLLGA